MVTLTPADMDLLMAPMRPKYRPEEFAPAYDVFERLLCSLLLRGAASVVGDMRTLQSELRQRRVRSYARDEVYDIEFARRVMAVARWGPEPIPVQTAFEVWPVGSKAEAELAYLLVNLIRAGLPALMARSGASGLRALVASLGAPWPAVKDFRPEPRGSGRPAGVVQQSLLSAGARETAFHGGAATKDIAVAIAAVSNGTSEASIKRRLRDARMKAPVPAGWADTLLSKRIAPLHSNLFSPAGDGAAPIVSAKNNGIWPEAPK